MIQLDGSQGEGGGQILRTALALSLCTGQPFRIAKIRAGRQKPGLLRQHLTAVNAAAQVGNATLSGADMGSQELTFTPGAVRPGAYEFAVGTAGSATLVLQTVLPALMTAGEVSTVTCRGGTHNPFAPPFEFVDRCFAPQLRKMGVGLDLTLVTPGFYPAGGGEIRGVITPCAKLRPISILENGEFRHRRVHIYLVHLGMEIARNEIALLKNHFAPDEILPPYTHFPNTPGPGHAILLERSYENATEIVSAFGEKGMPAPAVVRQAVEGYQAHVASNAVVSEHLADQLMVPFALAGGGEFVTGRPSSHAVTNAQTISRFLETKIEFREEAEKTWRCVVG